MLRISKLTDYATVILAHLPDEEPARRTAVELAELTGIGLATTSKVLKELQRAGLVASTRGTHGGYALARPAATISAADIIDAVEGPVGLTECATHPGNFRHGKGRPDFAQAHQRVGMRRNGARRIAGAARSLRRRCRRLRRLLWLLCSPR